MANFDWRSIVSVLAPTLGTAFGGPLGGAAGKLVAAAVLGKEDANDKELADVFSKGLSPDAVIALKKADHDFDLQMKAMDIDLVKISAETEKAYLGDIQNARKAHSDNNNVFRLGITILGIFAGIMGAVLWASFQVLTGGIIIRDIGTVAMVSGLIGTVVGYVASNAQQVVNYFYGSSKGSSDKTESMGRVIASIGANK